jgi:hypothetical protein
MVASGRILRFEPVLNGEFTTPSRKRGGVLVYGSGPSDALGQDRGKSRRNGAFGAS